VLANGSNTVNAVYLADALASEFKNILDKKVGQMIIAKARMMKFEDIHEAQLADYWSKLAVGALKTLRNVKSHPELLSVWWRLIAANKRLAATATDLVDRVLAVTD
jgi:hypothetical protein